MTFLAPQHHVDESQLNRGLSALLYEGVFSQVMGVLGGGAFLVALALLIQPEAKFVAFAFSFPTRAA